jgi:O-antigen ligase
MVNKFILFFEKKWQKLIADYFSRDENQTRRIIFNVLTIFLFISIVLTMGFTRVYPLNIFLKFTLLVTNCLIIIYIIAYSEIKIDKFLILIIFSLLWFSFIAFINKNIIRQQSILLNVLNMIPTYLIISSFDKMRKTMFSGIIVGLLLFTLIFSLYYFRELLSFNFSVRLGSFFGNQNDVAATLLIAATIFVYFGFRGKYLYFAPAFLSALNLIATGSRAGVLNLVVIVLLLFISIFVKKNKIILCAGLVVFIISIVLIFVFPVFGSLKERMIGMLNVLIGNDPSADYSTFYRLEAISESLLLFLLSPIWGHNIFMYQFSTNEMVAHNALLEIATQQGIISLLLFIAIFIYPLIKLTKSKYEHRLLLISIIVGSLLFHLTLSGLPFKEQYLILALSMAFLQNKHYFILNPRKNYLKAVLKNNIIFYNNFDYSLMSFIDFNLLNSNKNIIAVNDDVSISNLNISNQYIFEKVIKKVELDNEFVFDVNKYNKTNNYLFIISGIDTSNVSHLMLLNYLTKHNNYKIIIVAQEKDFAIELLSLSFYKGLINNFINFSKSLVKQPVSLFSKQNKSFQTHQEGSSTDRSDIIDNVFLGIFNLLALVSFHYGAKDIVLWQKMLLILFASIYYFQVINSIYLNKNLNNIKNLLLIISFVSILPCSIFYIVSLLIPNIFNLSPLSICFVVFVFFTNIVTIMLRYYLNIKKQNKS